MTENRTIRAHDSNAFGVNLDTLIGLQRAACVTDGRPAGQMSRLGEILVIDDDAVLGRQVVGFLSERDCRARAARRSNELPALVGRGQWGLILLDIEPSPGRGLDCLRAIRSLSDVPVLVAGRHLTPADRILALELGADGYLDKPFDLHQFWAQARAIERRQAFDRSATTRREARGGYRFNGWTLNLSDRSLREPAGTPVPLSRSAYALLLAFLDAPGRILSRAFLLQTMCAREEIFDRSVDVKVLRLRRTLERGSGAKRIIRTERGTGYMFDAVVERLH